MARFHTSSFLSKHFIIRDRILFDYELIFILDGQCKITIDKKEYLCQKDQIVFIPPNVLNRFETLDQDFHQPHIHFDIIYDEKSEYEKGEVYLRSRIQNG